MVNEPSDSIEGRKFDQLTHYQLLEDSAPHEELILLAL
jgi:hypothetical protein